MNIGDYLNEEHVAFLASTTRDEVLDALIHMLDKRGKLRNKTQFHQAILNREQITSTGIGMGVAIPHAKLPNYEEFFIGIGILKSGVEWDAIDGAPVRIVFMIGGPEDRQTEYLKILSALTTAIKDEERRKKLLTLKSPEAIIELFNAY